MKQAIIPLLATVLLASCGGGSTSTSATHTSGIKERAFVSNSIRNQIEIVNAANDTENTTISFDALGNTVLTPANVIGVTSPSIMALSPDKSITMVYDSSINTVSVINNTTEADVGAITLPSFSESIAAADNKTGYAAVRNAPVSGQPNGAVEVLDLAGFTISATIPVPSARRLVLSHNGSKLLAFSDDATHLWVIDTASKTATAVNGFDHAAFGVFTSDDSKAYILNCGPECGGTTAGVTILDMSSNTPGANVPVSAATVGLLDGSNLYVAGTAASGGRLDVINTGNFTVAKSGVAISDGYHQLMTLGADGQLFIGARTCSNVTQGCLSIYNTSSQSAVVSAPNGDVTGMAPITNRHVVYVIEGGELRIYDTTTEAPQKTQIDVVGQAVDVKLVD